MRLPAAVVVLLAVGVGAGSGAAAVPVPVRGQIVGRSVLGRPLRLVRVGEPDAPRKVLVVGCIHGTERAGLAITRALRSVTPPEGSQLLVLDEVNPDGCAAGTRGNAHGVDLNRNFPWGWRPLHGVFASGPHADSEPETRAAQRLILRERPAVTIWFHQHLNWVDLQPGSSGRLMRTYARTVHLRAVHTVRLPGTVTRWQNHRRPDADAFVVELAAGRLSPVQVRRHVTAILAVARR